MDKKSIAGYGTLVKSMPDAAWSEAPLKDHFVRLMDRINAMHNNPDYLSNLLPIAAGVFKFTVDGKVGQGLAQLLTNAVGTPNAYVVVHHSLKGVWPELSPNIGNYNPDVIFARACQFIRDQPGNAGVGDVYESVCDAAQRGLSGPAINQGIADITPIVWRMEPGIVAALSGFIATILTPENLSEILTGVQAQKLGSGDLSQILAAISKAFDKDKRHDAAKRILALAPVQLLERPDGAFEWWISAGSKDEPEFARIHDSVFVGSPASVEAILKDSARPKTRSALVGRLTKIVSACQSDASRSRLANHMIVSLPSLSGDELHSVALNIGDLGGTGALERDSQTLGLLDADQFNVLEKVFTSSRRIRDASKKT